MDKPQACTAKDPLLFIELEYGSEGGLRRQGLHRPHVRKQFVEGLARRTWNFPQLYSFLSWISIFMRTPHVFLLGAPMFESSSIWGGRCEVENH